VSDFSDKVHESQFDVLGRVIPGAIVLLLWNPTQVNPSSTQLWELLVAIIPAYLIGFCLEHVSMFLIDQLLMDPWLIEPTKKGRWYSLLDRKWWGHLCSAPVIWHECNSGQSRFEARIFKMLAERTMFRSLIMVFLFASFWPPKVYEWSWYLRSPLFFFCMLCCTYSFMKVTEFASGFVTYRDMYKKDSTSQN
jgi:hypothetical protein